MSVILKESNKKVGLDMLSIGCKDTINRYIEKYDIRSYFSELDIDDFELCKFNNREILFEEGSEVKYLYFLVQGNTKVSISQKNGRSHLLCFVEAFDIFGEVEYFTRTEYTTTAIAIKDVYCLRISIDVLDKKYSMDPILLKLMSERLAFKLLSSSNNSTKNLLNPLDTRLASYIIMTSEGGVFQDNLTNVSELLATSYRHLIRVLSSFCSEGLIEKKKSYYEIKDMSKLKELADRH